MMDIYRRAKSEAKYDATCYFQMLGEHRGLETARLLLQRGKGSEGSRSLGAWPSRFDCRALIPFSACKSNLAVSSPDAHEHLEIASRIVFRLRLCAAKMSIMATSKRSSRFDVMAAPSSENTTPSKIIPDAANLITSTYWQLSVRAGSHAGFAATA